MNSSKMPRARARPCVEQHRLRILLVSTSDMGGGAERSAWNLFKAYAARGHRSWMAVGTKRSEDPDIALIPNESCRNRWERLWLGLTGQLEPKWGNIRGVGRLCWLLRCIANPRRFMDLERGHEDFHFPGTWQLLKLFGVADIVHCYNLHESYFDLRALTRLSHHLPVILDLRDAWLLSGHCAHSFDCERWKTGCGNCPDLKIYPAIRRDATAYNWRRKKEIYASSRLYVATPSEWLMRKVSQSMLAPAIVEAKVIPTGLDLSVYHPGEKAVARAALGLPRDAKVLLFAANKTRRNIWKDHETLRTAVTLFAEQSRERNILFIALGEAAPSEWAGGAELRFIAHQKTPEMVVRYYQAADLYVHAARADTFPRVVLEALACGIPVVATAVGGIPEQIKGLNIDCGFQGPELNRYTLDEATGVLAPEGDAAVMAVAIERLLNDEALRCRMSENAVKDVHERFDLDRQANSYLHWYEELLQQRFQQNDRRGVFS